MPACVKRLRYATKYTLPVEGLEIKRYYFDMDETLCLTPDSRDYSKAIPVYKMIAEVNRLHHEGHEITIYTSRGGTSGVDYTSLCIQQLKTWGVRYHHFKNGKPSYDVLIDDKAVNTTAWREQQGIKLVGLVASCFDLLHAGHCLYLKDARSKCDHLVAALQRDPTMDRPEKNQPVQSLEERLIQLEACKYVDEIIQYDTEEDLVAIMRKVLPDVRFVGSDTDPTKVTGVEYCGSVYVHDRSHGYSSSELRQRIADA
jgi:glycerol-3-phosphate cytidylyltransferase